MESDSTLEYVDPIVNADDVVPATKKTNRRGIDEDVDIVAHFNPKMSVAKRLIEMERCLEARHRDVIAEIRSARKFSLQCFSSLLLELPETPVIPPVRSAEDRVTGFLKRLGLTCKCLEP